MGHTRLIVNNEVLLNDTIDQSQPQPPEALARYLKPNAPKPPIWLRAAMITIADHALTPKNLDITITTHPHSWTLDAHYEP
jgi:hypothetical protein